MSLNFFNAFQIKALKKIVDMMWAALKKEKYKGIPLLL